MSKYRVHSKNMPPITFDTKAEANKYYNWASGGKPENASFEIIEDGGIPVDPRLTAAFEQLRLKGYAAFENHWCCSSCGWSAIPDEQADRAVFYHSQDYNQFVETRTGYLVWSGDGQEICNTLTEAGLRVEWNGSPDTRILVIL